MAVRFFHNLTPPCEHSSRPLIVSHHFRTAHSPGSNGLITVSSLFSCMARFRKRMVLGGLCLKPIVMSCYLFLSNPERVAPHRRPR
jgi:hypothetical protein